MKKLMVISALLVVLTGCESGEAAVTSTDCRAVKEETVSQNKKTNLVNESASKYPSNEQIGYVKGLSPKKLGLSKTASDNKVSIYVDLTHVDARVKAKLREGQKIKITYSRVRFSSPAIAVPITLQTIHK
ncbi:hypothetical protein [Priestia koreensis]|uniref:hypothetical protein n=1 Tax=Priestia koreensis TaxID=284581 RepID=UPI00345B04D4